MVECAAAEFSSTVLFYSGDQFWAKLSNGGDCTDFDFTSEKPIFNGWEMVVKNTVSSYESSALPLSYSGEQGRKRAGSGMKIQPIFCYHLRSPVAQAASGAHPTALGSALPAPLCAWAETKSAANEKI